MLEYIPDIDFSKFEIGHAQEWLKTVENKRKIFISNNFALSGQSINFSFDNVILNLSSRFPETLFITTNGIPKTPRENIVNINNVIGFDVHNLNECAYISTKCDALIGRGSGPATFSINKDNIIRNKKMFIYFTKHPSHGDMGIPELIGNYGGFFWSSDFSEQGAENFIIDHIII